MTLNLNSIQDDPETGAIALCAIRYAVGRRTYMPSLVVDWCKRHWQELPENDRRIIAKEVDELTNSTYYLGDECDQITWCGFAEWLNNQERSDRTRFTPQDPPLLPILVGRTYRNLKKGTFYKLMGFGRLADPIELTDCLLVYQSLDPENPSEFYIRTLSKFRGDDKPRFELVEEECDRS